jgi:hypothetical protein
VYYITGKAATLIASSLLHTYSSSPLHPQQWEVEARQFYETSLARAQFEAKYIAEGVYASFPGWVLDSPDIVSPAICRHNYLSKDPEYANVNGVIYLMVLVPCVLIIVLSCPWDDMLLWKWLLGQERAGRWADQAVSGLEVLGWVVRRVVGRGWIALMMVWNRV